MTVTRTPPPPPRQNWHYDSYFIEQLNKRKQQAGDEKAILPRLDAPGYRPA